MRGNILITEGINAGIELLGPAADGRGRRRPVGRRRDPRRQESSASPRDPTWRRSSTDANAQTAELRNQVIGTQLNDITRAPTRLFESEMGNIVADSMRLKYPGVDAAYTNSGGLRANLVFAPPSAGEQPGEITWGEVFAVLPFGNRSTIITLTGAQLQTAFLNGFTPSCDPAFAGRHRPVPADLGPQGPVPLQRHRPRRRQHVENAGRNRRDRRH